MDESTDDGIGLVNGISVNGERHLCVTRDIQIDLLFGHFPQSVEEIRRRCVVQPLIGTHEQIVQKRSSPIVKLLSRNGYVCRDSISLCTRKRKTKSEMK